MLNGHIIINSHKLRIYLIFATIIYILGNSSIAISQNPYSTSTISGNEGLPTEEIRKVFKGSKGFMWFATPEGLVRYDGYELKLYSTSTYLAKGLITNSFSDIAQSTDGNLWFATDHGIAKLDIDNDRFSFFNTFEKSWDSKSYNKINSVTIDEFDNLWVGTAGDGVLKLNTTDNSYEEFNKEDTRMGMTSEWITKIYCDSQNNIWISTWEGNLIIINPKKNIFKTYEGIDNQVIFSENTPYAICETNDNKYWLGLWEKGLICISLDQDYNIKTEGRHNNISSDNITYDIDIDPNGTLWLGTTNGVIQIKKPLNETPEFSSITATSSESSNTPQYEAFSILCDDNDFVWAGTLTGVYLSNPYSQHFTTYKIPINSKKLLSQAATAFTKDPNNNLLIGLRGYGFGKYSFTDKRFVPYTSMPEYQKLTPDLNTINCFLWDTDGFLWLGTRYLGLIKYDPLTGSSIEISQDNTAYNFEAESVVDLMQDHLGNIWAGTEKGLYKIIKHYPAGLENFSLISYKHKNDDPNSISSNLISKIIEDNNHQLWVSTFDKGINLLKTSLEAHFPAQFEHAGSDHPRFLNVPQQISTMHKGHDGTIWLGTTGGKLLKKTPDNINFSQVKEVDNIIGEAIFSIIEDDNSILWIASSLGIIRLSLKENKVSYSVFPKSEQLLNNNFIRNACYKGKDGKIYLGGNRGFNAFYPDSVKSNPSIPPVAITNIKHGNQIIKTPSNNAPLIINHNSNTLSFTFSALSYASPENNNYIIKLEGVDNDWRYIRSSIREITYANLKPGEYTLRYNASNNNGLWRPQPRSLRVIVKPAYYETGWAISLYFGIILSTLLYIIIKERKTHKIMRELEIEHIEHEKSENLLDFKKQLFANISNEFITPLNVLNVYMENWKNLRSSPPQQDLLLAQRNINRLIRFNKQFLYYSTAESDQIPLNITVENLNNFTSDVCDNFGLLMSKKEILFTRDIQINEACFDTDKLDIILYNLLTLALKDTSYKGFISIQAHSVNKNDTDYAQFIITHNHLQLNDVPDVLLTDESEYMTGNIGIGLAITKQMIELHRGEIKFSTNNNERVITFNIPISQNAYQDINTENGKITKEDIGFLKNKLEIEEEVLVNLRNLVKESDEKSIITIIDPDQDLRRILKKQLSPFFNVKEFSNAQTGLKNILKQTPDLIISDTLSSYPLTGKDLCKEVKKSGSNKVIPFIMLSGQPSENERAICYKAGADSYIAKPLDINTLLVRVQNLINQKNSFKEDKPVRNDAFSKTITKGKDKFLNEIKTSVEKNISNPNFGVGDLASELNISNSMLYRKLTNSINLSPNMFIKKMRLIKAVELLEETTLNVSEISGECGFSDISYFGQTFKKEYGVSPSTYRRNFHKFSNINK